MATANDSKDGKSALLEKPLNEQGNVEEVIFPAVEKRPRQGDAEDVIFPTIERAPTAKELEAPISPAVPEAAVVIAEKEPGAKTEEPISGRRKLILLLPGLLIVAVGISMFFYLQNQPKPVPTPKSVD